MGFLFSMCKEKNQEPQIVRKPQQQLSQQDQTIIELKNQRDKLKDKTDQIQIQIDSTEKEIIIYVKQNQKERARFAISKKKLYEKYQIDILNKDIVIRKMINDVQNAIQDKELATVMKQTNEFLKDIQTSIDIDSFQDVVYDMNENKQKQSQLNELFEKYGADDQDEVNGVYNQYEADMVKEQLQQNDVRPEKVADWNNVQVEQKNNQQSNKQPSKQEQEKKKELDFLLE